MTCRSKWIKEGLETTWNSWRAMKNRCNVPQDRCFHLYGGKGISYEPRWEDFEFFLEDMGMKPKGMVLDRIDNEAGYCWENCRWTTWSNSSRNTKQVKLTEYKVKLIRGLLASKRPTYPKVAFYHEVAKTFNISWKTVAYLATGRGWE